MPRARAIAGLSALVALCAIATAARADRPNSPNTTELFRYAPGDVVESFASLGGNFRVHFTRAGANAVPSADGNVNGTPDHVEETAALYEEVLALYKQLGFRAPPPDGSVSPNGGDARFDVYLLDFAGKADGSFRPEDCDDDGICTGFMVQENDFTGYAYPSATIGNRILASHEFFHAVQAAYDNREGTILGEGTAVWATERFDPTLNDLEGFTKGYLSRPDRSLDMPLPGPVDAFSYGSSIFFQFLGEKYGEPIIRELLEDSAGATGWFPALDARLRSSYATSFADAYFTFTRWNLYTRLRADASRSYARGSGYPLVRVDTMAAPQTVDALRIFSASALYLGVAPAGRAQVEASLVIPAGSAMRLALAVRRGNTIADPVIADATLRVSADATGADEVIVLVVNTAQSGESLKPGVCIGDTAEVDACRTQLGAVTPMPMPPSGGCTLTTRAPSGLPGFFVFGLLFGVVLLLRSRVTGRG